MASATKESARFLAYLLISQWKTSAAIGIGIGLGHPKTRSATWRGVRWGGSNVARPILGGYARAGSNVAGALSRLFTPFVAGYLIGATAGTGIAHVAFGDEGRDLAFDLYTSPTAFLNEGLLKMPTNARQILNHYM